MILLRKTRKSTISGMEITTTAAIMAGMLSRPKPCSRLYWIPLDTRKYSGLSVINRGHT